MVDGVNAFERSHKVNNDIFLLSIFSYILSVTGVKAVSVDILERKPC